ncbi:hypothetical protein AAFN88_07430 [Pelagibius sp. CAU 1746]|uniref:hypothetical protein n=1 Tax=Pelagibius sp. CAU 1746 TaxID=3140370 RepID=UPI00325AA7D5
MIEARKSSRLSPQEKNLQTMLLSMTVPFRDGGGLVFPLGFPFAGYELDEWQFERYRSLLDRSLLSPEMKREGRVVVAVFFTLVGVIIGGSIFTYSFSLFENSPVGQGLRQWFPVVWFAPFVLFVVYSYAFAQRFARAVQEQFPGARKTSRTAYLRRRLLGYMAAKSFKPLRALALVLFALPLGVLMLAAGLWIPVAYYAFLGLLLLFVAAFKGCLLLVYWSFRRRQGCGPTAENLKPV